MSNHHAPGFQQNVCHCPMPADFHFSPESSNFGSWQLHPFLLVSKNFQVMAGQAAFDVVFGSSVRDYERPKPEKSEQDEDSGEKVKLTKLNGMDMMAVTDPDDRLLEAPDPEQGQLWRFLAMASHQMSDGRFEDPNANKALEDVQRDPFLAIADEPGVAAAGDALAILDGAVEEKGIDRSGAEDTRKRKLNDAELEAPAEQKPVSQGSDGNQEAAAPDRESEGPPPVHCSTSTFARRTRPKTKLAGQVKWEILRAAFFHEIKPSLTFSSAHEDSPHFF